MAESVYRVTEVIGSSSESWEAAARNAVETAAATVRDLRVAEVLRSDVTIENGQVTGYRVRLGDLVQVPGRRLSAGRCRDGAVVRARASSDTPLLGETIGANLERAVAAHGEREALVVRHQGIRWTYAELDEQVDRVARGLLAARAASRATGWGSGRPNCAEWVLVQYATAQASA